MNDIWVLSFSTSKPNLHAQIPIVKKIKIAQNLMQVVPLAEGMIAYFPRGSKPNLHACLVVKLEKENKWVSDTWYMDYGRHK